MSLIFWIIHGHIRSRFWRMTLPLSKLGERGFHYFLVELGETWLALAYSFDREMEGQDIHVFNIRVGEMIVTL